MTLEDQKALADKIAKETSDKIAEAQKNVETIAAKAGEEAAKNGGFVSKETMDTYKAENKTLFEEIEKASKAQGIALTELQQKSLGGVMNSAFSKMKNMFEEKKTELAQITKMRAGSVELKNVINVAGISAGNSYSGVAIASSVTAGSTSILSGNDGAEVFVRSRKPLTLLDFADTQTSNATNVVWFEENNRTGSFQLTAEGALKPFVGYGFTKQTTDWKKVAGRAPFTEEFMIDFPLLYSTIQSLMRNDCRVDLDGALLTDATTAAAPYLNPALAGKIDNADQYGAIGAVIAQIQLADYTPDFIAMSPADVWQMKLIKGTDGHYIMPPFNYNDADMPSLRVVVSSRITPGNFFVGDSSAYKVRLRGDVDVRIGYAADTNDFVRNQMTTIVELGYFNYIPASMRPAFVYANYGVVITAIEKP